MIHLIVFDLDGTLVDSRQDLAESTNVLIAERGGRPLDQDAVVHMVGEGVVKLLTRAFAAAGLGAVSDPAVERFLQIYADRLLLNTRPYPGVPEALAGLSPLVPLAVLTNKPRRHTEAILAGLKLATFFRAVQGGDGPFPRKPNPEALRNLSTEFDAGPAGTLLVGDSAIDLRTARAAGTAIALVRYGFGFADIPAGELTGTELFLDAPGELLHLVAR